MDRLILLKTVDSVIGRFAVSLFGIKHRRNPTSLEKILIIRPGGIGDAVLLIPSIIAIKKKYPSVSIDILAEKRNFEVFSLCREVNRVFLYDRPIEFLYAIRGRYDIVIDTEQWHRLSAVIARLTRAPVSIGYATNERKKLFTHPIPYSHEDYEVDSFLNLVSPLVGKVFFDQNKPFLSVPSEVTGRGSSLLQTLLGHKVVAVFPGGSIPERRWGVERFHETAKMLTGKGYGIVILGGKREIREGDEISRGLDNVMNLCGRLSLIETAAILKEVSMLITGDSGLMHIAYGLGTRVVALFGPGIEKKWAPRGKGNIVINKKVNCSPCTSFGYTSRCKKNSECMNQITVKEVFEKTTDLLEG